MVQSILLMVLNTSMLHTLDISFYDIGDEGSKDLAKPLMYCTDLHSLVIAIGADGAKGLAHCLKHCYGSLHTCIHDNGIKDLAYVFKDCSKLHTLIPILLVHTVQIILLMVLNTVACCIHLISIPIILVQMVQSIFLMVLNTSMLHTLDIHSNLIYADGAKYLADGIKHCSMLNISSNHIGYDGTKYLADGIKH